MLQVNAHLTPITNHKNCLFWIGKLDKSLYPEICVGIDGIPPDKVAVHRLIYFSAYPSHVYLDLQSLQVSHICHQKQCVYWKHLVLEHKDINNQRNSCQKYGFCLKDHKGKPCLF